MITRAPIPGLSRRAVFRLLGAATVAGAAWPGETTIVGASAGSSLGWPAETPQETVVIPYHATVVRSGVLARGQQYRLRVSGVIITNLRTKLGALAIDATSLFITGRGADTVDARCVAGPAVGLEINHEPSFPGAAARWGACTPSHVYERIVAGDDRPLVFSIAGPTMGERISGELTVQIHCA